MLTHSRNWYLTRWIKLRRPKSRQPMSGNIEQFEDRVLLAGDVLMSLRGSTLTIKGDASANEIAFVPGLTANSVVVNGLMGTTLNGMATFTFPSSVSTIKLNLGDGDDVVRVDDVEVGNLTGNLGNGNDDLEIERNDAHSIGTTLNSLNINGGAGNDTFNFGIAGDVNNQLTVTSKFHLVGGKGNDSRSTITSDLIAGTPKITTVEVVTPDPPPVVDTLTSSASTILVNQNEEVTFQAKLTNPAVGTEVDLSTANSAGIPDSGGFLFQLFDDGSPLHDDAVAGDGIYTNSIAVNLATLGDQFYSAQVVNNGTVSKTLVTHVTAVAAPTAEAFSQNVSNVSALQTQLDSAIAGGQSVSAALAAIRTQLLGMSNVNASSISVTSTGIYWTLNDGETQGIQAAVPGALTKGGSSSVSPDVDPSATAAVTHSAPEVTANDSAPLKFTGNALILASFFYQFEVNGFGDESNDIDTILTNAGMTTQFDANTSVSGPGSNNVGVDSFKGLGQYDVVSISAHGSLRPGLGEVVNTGQLVTDNDVNNLSLMADYRAHRLTLGSVNGRTYWDITPAFITYYAGQMNHTIVYVSACECAENGTMAAAFLGKGASAYIGYSDTVNTPFSNSHGIALFNYLTDPNGHLSTDATPVTVPNRVGDVPGIDVDIDPTAPHALYTYFGDPNATLPTNGDLLKNTQLFVSYTWGVSQRDLDSNTDFVGSSVGYATPGPSTYLTFSGDNTSAGGGENVYVDLFNSYQAGAWAGSTDVDMNAGWYIPAGGSGPATLTVAFYNTVTQTYTHVTKRTINPGQEDGAASAPVGTAHIVVTLNNDNPDNDTVAFTLI
ncbi:MAG: hypothetical protein JWM11_3398 [Planctomycetaceae bacterium]|nr:hypothetical protein [Planctomycetaceae bacterium]